MIFPSLIEREKLRNLKRGERGEKTTRCLLVRKMGCHRIVIDSRYNLLEILLLSRMFSNSLSISESEYDSEIMVQGSPHLTSGSISIPGEPTQVTQLWQKFLHLLKYEISPFLSFSSIRESLFFFPFRFSDIIDGRIKG